MWLQTGYGVASVTIVGAYHGHRGPITVVDIEVVACDDAIWSGWRNP